MKKALLILLMMVLATPALADSTRLTCGAGQIPIAVHVNRDGTETTVVTGFNGTHMSRGRWRKDQLEWDVINGPVTFHFAINFRTNFLVITPPADFNEPEIRDPTCREGF